MRRCFQFVASAIIALLLPGAAGATEPLVVDEVDIVGESRVEEAAVRVHLRVRPGQPFTREDLDRDVRSVYAMGFFEDVIARIETRGDERVLVVEIVERPLINEVVIEGEDELSKEDLEAAIRIRANTILDLGKVHRGIEEAKKLYDQKGYKDAKITFETSDPDEEGKVTATFRVDEGDVVRIHDLRIEGNEAFGDWKLSRILQTKEKWMFSWLTGAGNLDREVLQTDVERLTAFYYENGYVNVRVDEPSVERDDEGLVVTFKIDEGDQFRVGEISLEGDLLDEVGNVEDRLELETGEVFRASHLREDLFSITELYGDFGYAFANVEPITQVEPAERAVHVTYRIDKGPLVTFNRIEIKGNTKTRDEVIRRELAVREQQRFSSSRLKQSRARVQRLGFFQEVDLTTRRTSQEDQLDLLINVKEAQTGAFTAGAGFSSADRFIFNARLSESNLFGSGDRVSLNADVGSIRQNFTLDYIDPYFLDTYFTAAFSGFNFQLEFDDFERSGTGASVRFLYPISALGYRSLLGVSLDEVRFGLEYKFEQTEIGEVSTFFRVPSIIAEEGKQTTSSVIPTLVRNTLNHPFDPTDGSVQNLSVEFAGVGGETNFLKVEGRTRWFYPFYKNEVLGTFVGSAGARAAWGRGEDGRSGKELPLFERFFPGGINSVRGFRARSLGPEEPVFDPNNVIVDTTPVGGSSQLVFTTELIFPIIEQVGLRGVLFFDAGNAYTAEEGLAVDDLRLAAGWGFRWLSPIGPLRIEIGYPLDREPGERSNVFLFSFGAPL